MKSNMAKHQSESDVFHTIKDEFINHQHIHDLQTGLFNRQHFDKLLEEMIAQSRTQGQSFALVILDLNRFKNINDSLGYEVGNQILKLVAQRLSRSISENAILSRVRDDEFAILIKNVISREEISNVCHQLLKELEQAFHLNSQSIYLTLHIGAALCPSDGFTSTDLKQHANIALEYAKQKFSSHVVLFQQEMVKEDPKLQGLEQDVHAAMERKEFSLYYQPKMNLHTGAITGMEALLRWQHPRYGMLYPDQFIRPIERVHLMQKLGAWIIQTACQQTHQWHEQGFKDIHIAINLSKQQLKEIYLLQQILSVLQQTHLSPNFIELELTETQILRSSNEVLKLLKSLNDLNVQIVMDDFGGGDSSAKFIKQFPFSALKIDQQYIQAISNQQGGFKHVRSLIDMAKKLHLKVVAEGIEDPEQVQLLRSLDCDFAQGFYIGKPMPADQCSVWLHEHYWHCHPQVN